MTALRRLLAGPASALIVPVPEAEPLLAGAPVAALGPHITVLYPFRRSRELDDATLERLAALATATDAFDYELAELGRFPGVLYVAPRPAEPFAALVARCAAQWPEHPPYGGAFAETVPHLTLAEGDEPAGLAERATARLPLAARADQLWLMTRQRGGWRRRAALPLGR